MKGQILILLLFVAAPILGACTEGTAADGRPTPGADAQAIELAGYQVYNLAGRWLGEVAGVLLDLDTGGIGYVVLSYREPRVYGRAVMFIEPQRFVPIPWALFQPGEGEGTLCLNADDLSLIPAPYLDEPPSSLSTAQASAIDRYWLSVGGEGS